MGQGHDRHARRFQHGCRGIRSRAHGRRARPERRRDPHRAARRGVRAARDDVRRQHGRRRAGARERARGAGLVRAGQLGRADHAAVLHRRRLLELPPLAIDALPGRDRRPTTCAPASNGSSVRRSRSWWSSRAASPPSPSRACPPSSSRPRGSASASRSGSSACTSRSRRSCRSCCARTSGRGCSTPLVLLAAVVAVDVTRLSTGVDAIGFLNLLLVWLLVQQLGFHLADGGVDGARARRARGHRRRRARVPGGPDRRRALPRRHAREPEPADGVPGRARRRAARALPARAAAHPRLGRASGCLAADLVRRRARDDRLPLAHARAHRARRPEPRGERGWSGCRCPSR